MKYSSCNNNSISTDQLNQIINNSKSHRIKQSTRKVYYSIWQQFSEFFIKLDRKPGNWEDLILLFAGHLIHKKRKSNTVKSYISAIKTTLKANSINISEDSYLLASLTHACKLKNDRVKTQLPIQKGMLSVLLRKVQSHFCSQPYLALLYTSLFSTMYFGLFRISEMVSTEHAVKACDVHVGSNKRKFLFVLHTLKTHNRGSTPQMIKISSSDNRLNKTHSSAQLPCPFELLHNYSQMRGGYSSPTEHYFIFSDGAPVTP